MPIIQLNTDNHIDGTDALEERVNAMLEQQLGRYFPRLSRIEVFLSTPTPGQVRRRRQAVCAGGAPEKRRPGGHQPRRRHHGAGHPRRLRQTQDSARHQDREAARLLSRDPRPGYAPCARHAASSSASRSRLMPAPNAAWRSAGSESNQASRSATVVASGRNVAGAIARVAHRAVAAVPGMRARDPDGRSTPFCSRSRPARG